MKQLPRVFPVFIIALLAAACSATTTNTSVEPGVQPAAQCKTDAECAGSADKPVCDVPTGACSALPPGSEIGHGDGTIASVTLTELYSVGAAAKLVDLSFDIGKPDVVWVVGYGDNSIHIGTGMDTETPTFKRIVDPAARHFMYKPPAIATGSPTLWATCGDNDNSQNGKANLFMGPATFTTDLAVLGQRTSGGLGSHFDMLHQSPNCRGIAHQANSVFWVFNDYDKSLDKYDFGKSHEPGGDDHSDGSIFRYAEGKVKGATDGTPSHIFFDSEDNFLYVADTGSKRILRLDTASGTKGGPLERTNEPLKDEGVMTGATLEVIVDAGVLEKPSGLEVRKGLIYVTDAATSTFHVFDKTGKLLRSLDTGLPAGSLAGFAFGPADKIYFTDKVAGRVLRIDPQ